MKLLDKFRAQPEWQSDDPVVRASAIHELSKEEGSQELLADIARQDPDPVVRLAAIGWIDDIDVLLSIFRNDDDDAVRTESLEIVRDLVIDTEDEAVGTRGLEGLSADRDLVAVARSARLVSVSSAALGRLVDQRAIAVVARRAALADVAAQALARLDNPQELQAVAEKTEDKATAVLAFERLVESDVGRDVLEQLAKRAKQKVVQRRARAALLVVEAPLGSRDAADPSPPAPPTRDHAALCAQLEALSAEEDLDHGRTTLDDLLQRWSELDEMPDEESKTRFTAARAAAEARLVALESERIARHREDEAKSAALAQTKQRELEEGLQALDKLLGEMEQLLESDAARGSAAWSAAGRRWRALVSEFGDVGGERLKALMARHDAVEQSRTTRAIEVRADREKFEQENLQRRTHLVSTIKGLIASEKLQLTEAERQLRSLRRAVDSPGPLPRSDREAVVRQLREAHTGLLGRVRELRDFADWQRWANLGIQEDLCRRMESLRELSDDAELTERFRDLMTRWREAADVPKDKGAELWQRFKTAHDVVHPRTERYREAQVALREQNLARQRALVEEAERLSSSTDWLKTVQRVTELQAEWKTVGTAPRRQQRELWNRFREACNTFFVRRKADLAERKQQWASNLRVKEGLCERVEGLATSEDLPSAMAAVKKAQVEWKAVGPVRRTRSDAIWTRFRTACDAVFERAQEGQREAEAERAAAREALCAEVESMVSDGSQPQDLAEKVREMQRRWREAPDVPPQVGRKLTARFGQGVARLVEKYPEVFRGTDLDPARLLKRLEKLCERIEALKPADADAAQSVSPAEILAAKWRDALASNLMGARVDEAAEKRSAVDEVRRAKQDVRRLGKVAGDEGRQLTERFHTACEHVLRWAEPKKASAASPPKPTSP